MFRQSDADVDDGSAKRVARRLKTFKPAALRQGVAKTRIHLLDVSASGVRAHGAAPAKGAFVTLDCDALSRGAIVAWSSGGRFGLAFLQQLSEAELRALSE
jgi:hypothetical protein